MVDAAVAIAGRRQPPPAKLAVADPGRNRATQTCLNQTIIHSPRPLLCVRVDDALGGAQTVQQWRVSDVMTTDVVTAPPDTSVGKLVDIMSTNRVSAVPVVSDERVVGIVSQADLLPKVAATDAGALRTRRRAAKADATSARDLMSAPALSIAPDATLSAAARKMQARKVKRLLVTGRSGRLLGIVSRADLLRLYTRPETAIRQDIIDHVLRRTMWIGPSEVQVDVAAGTATLTGAVGRRTTAAIVARLTAQVPGVVAVVDNIRYDFDDTTLARSRIHRTHPFSAEPFNP
jgi:CBS domain-containing protein